MSRVIGGMVVMLAVAFSHEPARGQAPTTRPHEPWVFRSVLDRHPRMITVALHEQLWVAYDATTCSLYRAWPGGVKFTGAVYDMRHGPQPQAQGKAYLSMPEAPATWPVMRDGKTVQVRPDYTGYTLDGTESVTLHYRLLLDDGTEVRIDETPAVENGQDGRPAFVRRITVTTPQGVLVKIPVAAGDSIMQNMAERDGEHLWVTAGGGESELVLKAELAAMEQAKQ